MDETSRSPLAAIDTAAVDSVTPVRCCVLCGMPASVGAVFLPDPREYDAPPGCYVAVPYNLCARCFRLPRQLICSAVEELLAGGPTL